MSNAMQNNEPVNSGLEGVLVATTAISDVQGERGDLSYRGRSIEHWVDGDFEAAAAAVLNLAQLAPQLDLRAELGRRGALTRAKQMPVASSRSYFL